MAVLKGLRGDVGKFGGTVVDLGKNVGGAFQTVFTSAPGKANGVLTVASQPVRWAVQLARMPVQGVSWAYRTVPWVAVPATILGGVALVGNAMSSGAKKRTQQEAEARMNSMQGAYTNSVTPAEYAALTAKQDANANTGMAAAVQADRAAATQAATKA